MAGEVQPVYFVKILDNDGLASGLAHQAVDLGVPFFAEDDHRAAGSRRRAPRLGDVALQLQNHRAGAVDEVDPDGAGQLVGSRRFAVGTDQHGVAAAQLPQSVQINGDQALAGQTGNLGGVVHHSAQRMEPPA